MSVMAAQLLCCRVQRRPLTSSAAAAAAADGFLSFSGSMRTRTTPDLSTTSWISLPFLPITLPIKGARPRQSQSAETFNSLD